MKAFEVIEPAHDSPVLVEVPHAGLELDPVSMGWTIAPARSIVRDADLYVDQLFEAAPTLGATLLRAKLSRYVVDLNRCESDFDGRTVEGGSTADRPRGVIWRATSDGGAVLRERLPRAEYERRLNAFWRPYHTALADIVARKKRAFGFAVVVCGHSMPTPRARGLRAILPNAVADVVPGTRGRTSAAGRFIDVIDRVAREHSLGVEHDVPYRGGYTTEHYGRPDDGVHAIQIEVARRLYMDEDTLALDPQGSRRMKDFADALVVRLVALTHEEYASTFEGGAP